MRNCLANSVSCVNRFAKISLAATTFLATLAPSAFAQSTTEAAGGEANL